MESEMELSLTVIDIEGNPGAREVRAAVPKGSSQRSSKEILVGDPEMSSPNKLQELKRQRTEVQKEDWGMRIILEERHERYIGEHE
ncbi:hypothetical protein CRENBAI_017304 [Crenichthys baileyi]|uniref:Uncharacterized protein n=1 Tax=Crenichthys baileyi TaxID=28760 RepID=A0AAV9R2G8_9TELE